MTHLDILSGLGRKASAAIRVTHRAHSVLLDAGGPLHPEEQCNWVNNTGPLDAILISHDHPDHIGSVGRLPWSIPLYCTPEVAASLPQGRKWHALPVKGSTSIMGIEVTTGRAGHSYGGVWLHLGIGGGLFYSGDASLESELFPFDFPPPANTLVLDASYGLYDIDQTQCQLAIREELALPTVFPLPLSGRAVEIAIWLLKLEQEQSIDWTMDQHCLRVVRHWSQCAPDGFHPYITECLQRLASRDWPKYAKIILVADSNDNYQDWPEHQLLHTGYLTPDRRDRVAAGLEKWRRWNVHLRAKDLEMLGAKLGARDLVPVFTSLKQINAWRRRLGSQLHPNPNLVLHDQTETRDFYIPATR